MRLSYAAGWRMTWIVGRSLLFGYAVGLSDVRVTLADGAERDCLQKVYAVGPRIALGFAGSVAIGFSMVQRLSQLLRPVRPGKAWLPPVVAEWWPGDARQVFAAAPEVERALGCHLMMFGAHPNLNVGDSPWPQCYVYRFRGPDFAPIETAGMEVVSIGSGEGVEPYQRALEELGEDDSLLELEAAAPGASGWGLMSAVTSLIRRTPTRGISRHLHVCLVRRTGISIQPNDEHWFGHPEMDLVMPPVARSMGALERLLAATGLSVIGARC